MEDIDRTPEAAEMPVGFRLPLDEHEAFRLACRHEQRSMAGQLRILVRDWLQTKDEQSTKAAA